MTTGHFALDTAADEIAAVVHNFLRPAFLFRRSNGY